MNGRNPDSTENKRGRQDGVYTLLQNAVGFWNPSPGKAPLPSGRTEAEEKKRTLRSKVAALAAEHEVMTGFAANAEVQGINGDERESRGVTRRK